MGLLVLRRLRRLLRPALLLAPAFALAPASWLVLLASLPIRALAGPNAGGMLVVHDAGLTYTESGGPPWPSLTPTCGGIDAELPTGILPDSSAYLWKVYAVFPLTSSPRLRALSLGAVFPPSVTVVAGGPTDETAFEVPAGGWPFESGYGTMLSFGLVQTETVVECYWIAGFGSGGEWALARHPSQTLMFVDDQFPPIEDQIVGLGSIGFGHRGEVHCPDGPQIGACCFPGGGCTVLTREDCASGDGMFRGVNFTCAPDPCDAGACCLPSGQCFLVTEDECSFAGYYQGDLVPCDPHPCPQLVACCQGFECFLAMWFFCEDQGGVSYPNDFTCVPNPCPRSGACCLPDGSCRTLTRIECDAEGGDWHSAQCDHIHCPGPEACCYPDGHCETLSVHECWESGGLSQGDGTICTPNPCPPPAGACCLPLGYCYISGQSECSGWWMPWVPCVPNPCPQPLGACCLADGACLVTIEAQCSGNWMAAGVCEPNPCVGVEGACCLASGICVRVAETVCPGFWLGPDTPCQPNPCLSISGACCYPTGECLITTFLDCPQEWMGPETTCAPSPCEPPPQTPGACCFPDGSCYYVLAMYCGGDWLGVDSTCQPNPCPQPMGACCFADGTCRMLSQADCGSQQGIWSGPEATCVPNPCPGPVPVDQTSWGRIKLQYR